MLEREAILGATEEVLRRHGPAKAGVVDVARMLGVSHAAVYRHFPSKAALREAVTRRWLGRANGDLAAIANGPGPPDQRLRSWLRAMLESKRAAVAEDPELFATYRTLAGGHSAVAAEHIAELTAQLARIVDGFSVPDPDATARAVFEATAYFHHPALAADWARPDAPERLMRVCDLLLAGLTPSRARGRDSVPGEDRTDE